ncbi:hypothetical protein NPIL_277971 [Nephila pilipes]|uniref:Uncharacterized protein n=1 Tax=Nephila pilipes TaxID=299642 RepID=A0A8X6PA95_NEPPI|nr:hypothetical protein NPIL_277971 [Nephila pilipes]
MTLRIHLVPNNQRSNKNSKDVDDNHTSHLPASNEDTIYAQLTCEIVMADLMEPRVCSKFWLLLETKETKACQMLQRAFKKDVKRHVQDFEWFGRLKCGDMNLKTLLVLSALHHFQTTKALKKSTKKINEYYRSRIEEI